MLPEVKEKDTSVLRKVRRFRISFTENAIRKRFARGVSWSLITAVVTQGSSLLASVIAARLLGQRDFGALGLIQSTLGMFGVFAGMGLGLTTTKYVAEFRLSDPQRAGRIVACTTAVAALTGILATTVVILLGPALATHTLHAPELMWQLRIASALIFFNTLTGAQVGALAGFEAFRTIARASLVSGLITFPLIVGGVYTGGLSGAVWGIMLAAAVPALISRKVLLDECRRNGVEMNYRGAWGERKILWAFSLPAFLSDIVLSPVAWFASTMLVNRPMGYEQMGIFSAANQWRSLLMFIPSVVGQVLIPMTSSFLGQSRDSRGIRSALVAAISVNALCAVPTLLILFLASRYVMSLYGPSFASHGAVLRFTAATGALMAIQIPVGNMIAGFGRMWVGASQNLAWAAVLLVSAWFLLHAGWGAEGLAAAYLISYVAHSVWTFWFGMRLLHSENPPVQLT